MFQSWSERDALPSFPKGKPCPFCLWSFRWYLFVFFFFVHSFVGLQHMPQRERIPRISKWILLSLASECDAAMCCKLLFFFFLTFLALFMRFPHSFGIDAAAISAEESKRIFRKLPGPNKTNNHFQLQFTRCHLSPVIDCCSLTSNKINYVRSLSELWPTVHPACAQWFAKMEKWKMTESIRKKIEMKNWKFGSRKQGKSLSSPLNQIV